MRGTPDPRELAIGVVAAAAARDVAGVAERWNDADPSEVAAAAAEQRVDGLVVDAAARAGVDGPALDVARQRSRYAAFLHLARLAALRQVGEALDRAGIPWLVIKGPVLQELAWESIPREYSDLDVLVPAESFADALTAVEAIGGRVLDRNWTKLRAELLGEVHCELADGTPLDLHWHVLNQRATRERFRLPVGELFDRARTVELPTGPARVLDATDALLHVALHAAISGGHRLVWLADIRASLEADPVDWAALSAAVGRYRVGLPVVAMLLRAERTVGAPVPTAFVEHMVTGRQRPLVRACSSWRAAGRLPGGGSTGRALARCLRDGLPATFSACRAEVVAMMRRVVERHEFWLDPSDERHVGYPSGGDAGRAAYVTEVMRTNAYGLSEMSPRSCLLGA